MSSISIGKLCELKYGKALRKDKRIHGVVPVYGSNGIVDYHNQSLVENETIIIGRKGSIGELHYVNGPSWPIDTTYFVELKDQYEVYLQWFYRVLGSLRLTDLNRSAAIPGLNRDDVYRIKIPLPPLDDQKRIAHLLGKVEGLIAQRKQHLQQLDALLKSVFLEMFGDPVRNEKGWDRPELEQFGKISTGNTPPRKDPSNYSSQHIEWIKTDNISADSVFISQAAEYLSETGATKARIVTKGALMVACIAGSVESIGRAALTNRTVAFNQQINAIQPKKDVNPLFLYVLFKISKAYIQSHASKGMKKILTKGDFEKITMIKPPVDLQNQFAAIVEKVEGIKTRYQRSLADLESLYGALSQKAFKGELDLSRIPLDREILHTEVTASFESALPKHINETLLKLNEFNKSATILKAVKEASQISQHLPQLGAVKQAVEQLAALRTPLQELKQMSEISKAMEHAQTAIKPLNLEYLEDIRKSAQLARSITVKLPKIDLGWLEQQKEALKKITTPFESMRRVMEQISNPARDIQESLRLQTETAKRLQSSIPDFTTWQKLIVDHDAVDIEDGQGVFRRQFTCEDVTAICANKSEPMSFDHLLQQLGELETVDFTGYETIKTILFKLLDEEKLTQYFDEKNKTLLLRVAL